MHPDGRVQRLRPAIGHPRGAGGQPGTACARCGRSSPTSPARSATIRAASAPARRSRAACSPPSRSTTGLTLEEIGGRGVRWAERERLRLARLGARRARRPRRPRRAAGDGKLRLGTYRPLWAAKEVDLSPALHFIRARAGRRALAGRRRARSGISEGDRVEVGNGTRVRAHVRAARRDPAPAACSSPRARARTAPTCSRPGWSRSTASAPGPTEPIAVADPVAARRRGPGRDAAVRAAADPAAARSTEPLAEVGYYEPWWMQILKAIAIFSVVFNLVPLALLADRKVLGRFQHRYGPNRVGPFGALQPIADIGKLRLQGAVPPGGRQRLAVRGRPGDLDDDRGGDDRDHPVLGRRRHLRHARPGSTASTRRSASSSPSPSAASPSTA